MTESKTTVQIQCTVCSHDLSGLDVEYHYSRNHGVEVPREILLLSLRESNAVIGALRDEIANKDKNQHDVWHKAAIVAYHQAAAVYHMCCATGRNVPAMTALSQRLLHPVVGDMVIVLHARGMEEHRIGRLITITSEAQPQEDPDDDDPYYETYYHVQNFGGDVTRWCNVHVVAVVNGFPYGPLVSA